MSEPCRYVHALVQLCKTRKTFNISMHKQQSIITRSRRSRLAGSVHSHMHCLLICDFCVSSSGAHRHVFSDGDRLGDSSPCSVKGCVMMAG